MVAEKRGGIAAIAIAILVIILIAAAAGAYLVLSTSGSNGQPSSQSTSQTTYCTTVSTFSSGPVQTNTTLACESFSTSQSTSPGLPVSSSTVPPSSSSSSPTTTSFSSSSSTNTSRLHTFNVHFEWSENSTSSGTVDTTVASGSFTITIDLDAGEGMATAHGNIDNTITGVCSGHDSVSYTFEVIGGIDTISNNLTLAFESPTPQTSTVAETCPDQGSGTVGYSWPSVVPETVVLPAVYGAKVEGTFGEVSYEIMLA